MNMNMTTGMDQHQHHTTPMPMLNPHGNHTTNMTGGDKMMGHDGNGNMVHMMKMVMQV